VCLPRARRRHGRTRALTLVLRGGRALWQTGTMAPPGYATMGVPNPQMGYSTLSAPNFQPAAFQPGFAPQ
jgi:hypothetical protein